MEAEPSFVCRRSRLTNGRQSVAARGVFQLSRALTEARKHWGSGLPLPQVGSLLPATNQEVARSSRAGRTKSLTIRKLHR